MQCPSPSVCFLEVSSLLKHTVAADVTDAGERISALLLLSVFSAHALSTDVVAVCMTDAFKGI